MKNILQHGNPFDTEELKGKINIGTAVTKHTEEQNFFLD